MSRSSTVATLCAALATTSGCKEHPPKRLEAPEPPAWELVAVGLPSALMSIDGASASDIYAVGADKGDGPLVLHFNGSAWAELPTGQHGDLWWVHAFPDGSALMGGARATVLRVKAGHFERLPNTGLARQTVYGVWGVSPEDFYAVGSASGRNGFVWHYFAGQFHDEPLPADLPMVAHGEPPGFFKAWGSGDDVWIVGSGGTILHRKGKGPFERIPTPVKDILFTVHGVRDRWVAVGGGSNGIALERDGSSVRDVSPLGAALIQGVFTSDADGDWASGERGGIYTRTAGKGPFRSVEHGLPLPPAMSLHSIFVDASHEVWAVGGNVLTPALDFGVLVHFGKPIPNVVLHPDTNSADATPPVECPKDVVQIAKDKSIARRWDEQALAAIRLDLPRPTVHARNLFHVSAAIWDAWAAYDTVGKGVFVRERQRADNVDDARKKAISYAAFGILMDRYKSAVGGPVTVACLGAVMRDLGYDPADTHDKGDDPIAVGNRIAHRIIEATANDGSNQAHDYADTTGFVSPNTPLVYDEPGAAMKDPNVWQKLNLSVAATQNGIVLPAGEQTYIGALWDGVTTFAGKRPSSDVPWGGSGPAPKVGAAMKGWITEIIRKESQLDPSDGATMDVSPGAYGHNSLGANDGKGWRLNPVTGKPYAPQIVLRADFGRVMAEFWADGPNSETPPGHWDVLANYVSDSKDFSRRLFGQGAPLDALSWDVHVYLALNGALHDAAIAAWGDKRRYVTSRPISLIRWMGGKGQSSDPKAPAYDPDGLPIVPGLVEVITKESSAPGQKHESLARYVGQVAVRGWLGEPADRAEQESGVAWIRAVDWIPYQRRDFVTPAFPAFPSGHSTSSRTGAEVLTLLTGSPYFPGGFAEYVAPASKFLKFEKGPVREVRLQWAAYSDASDEAGQSRLWGGIHIEPDDFVGRRMGYRAGHDGVTLARKFFKGDLSP
jgi:hypothetical protein